MKKNIQLLLFLLITGFCLAGCGDDVEEAIVSTTPPLTSYRPGDNFLADSMFWENMDRDQLRLDWREGSNIFCHFNYETMRLFMGTILGFRNDSIFVRDNISCESNSIVAYPIHFGEDEVTLYNFNGKKEDTYRPKK